MICKFCINTGVLRGQVINVVLVWGSVICVSYSSFLPESEPIYAYKRYTYKKTSGFHDNSQDSSQNLSNFAM